MVLLRNICLAFVLTLPWAPAMADQPRVSGSMGVAVHGYDVVSFFHGDEPVHGSPKYALRWRGAVWYFASAQTMLAFEMNPKAYVPQYGGYCALAMTSGALIPADPQVFTVHDGRLYLAHSPAALQIWQADIPGNIDKADEHWPGALSK